MHGTPQALNNTDFQSPSINKNLPPAPWDEPHRDRALLLCRAFRPMRAIGYNKIRMGGDRDGAYVVLDDFAGVKHAISLGISDNVDWDLEAAARGLTVHQFDHTVDGPPVQHPNFRFHKRMIRGRTHDPVTGERFTDGSITVGEILRDAGITEEASAILKMDIEGFEWPVFRNIAVEDLLKFRQIVVELHNFGQAGHDDLFQRMALGTARLTRFFDMVHVHGNNCQGPGWKCLAYDVNGFVVPDVFEVTMVNRRYYKTEPSGEEFPTPLDLPNDPQYPDLWLGRFNH